MNPRTWCLGIIACLCSATGLASGQAAPETALRGVVTDRRGNALVGAVVAISDKSTGMVRSARTAGHGEYLIAGIRPGTYVVTATVDGLAASSKPVDLAIGEFTEYNIPLTLTGSQESVEVSADILPLYPNQTQQADSINSSQVENLPNLGRNFVFPIFTVPGTSSSFAPTVQDPGVGTGFLSSGFSIGASNGRNNLVTIDGGENDYGSGALREMHVPIDSIAGYQVNRNGFAAEFGFTSGTAINMVTKSGTNEFHGGASGEFHDWNTDAGNYFDKLAGGNTKAFEQSALFSASLGGPIRKDRLFFFTAPEFDMLDAATVQNIAAEQQFQGIDSQPNGFGAGKCPGQDTSQQQVTQLCYLTQMANAGGTVGDLGRILLASPIFGNPLDDRILHALVTANDGRFDGIPVSPVGSGVRGLPGFSTPRGRYFNWVSKLDDSYDGAHPENRIGLRFALMRESDSVAPRPPYSGNEFQTDYTVTASWTRVRGSKFVNDLLLQVVPSNSATIEAPSPNGSEIDLGNQIQLGTPFSYPYIARFKRFQLGESLSWILGSHTLKFGASWRPDYYSVEEKLWFGGDWEFTDGTFTIEQIAGPQFASLLDTFNQSQGYKAGGPPSTNLTAVQAFLAGTPTLLLQADSNSNDRWSGWTHLFGAYVQDSWKASSRLNLDYGLRFDYDHEPNPVPASFRISPRIGLAWDVLGDHKTVVRAAGGLFVAPNTFMIPFYVNILGISGRYVNQNALAAWLPAPSIFAAWAEQRSLATTSEPNPPLTGGQLASLGMVIGPPGPTAYGNFIYTMAPHFEPSYSVQASVSVARQITRKMSLETAYLMYHAVHVEQILESNFVQDPLKTVDPFVGPYYIARPGTTAGEPNIAIFQNNTFSSVGSGSYHGGTISLSQRLDRQLQFRLNYTFSRAIDDTSDFSSLSTPFRPGQLNRDRSLSDFNITHNFVANAVYTTQLATGQRIVKQLLNNLTVSPIVFLRSGVPFTLLVPGMFNNIIGHNANARPWHEGRNEGIGKNFLSWDMKVSKRVGLKDERWRLDLFAQCQNLLNHTNFAAVNNNFPLDPNFPLPGSGTLQDGPYRMHGFAPTSVSQLSTPLSFTSAYPGRRVSLGLRVSF